MSSQTRMKSLIDQYYDIVTDRILVSKEDLTENEIKIIEIGFELIKEKLEDLKIVNDEIKRLAIENANLKAYSDNKDYDEEE